MSRRFFCAVVGLAALIACLGETARVSAKPPDLPINLQDIFTPQLAPQADGVDAPLSEGTITIAQNGSYSPPDDLLPPPPSAVHCSQAPLVLPDGKSPPARPKVSLKARCNLATCLLFGVHPLLALTATEEMVETRADHPYCPEFEYSDPETKWFYGYTRNLTDRNDNRNWHSCSWLLGQAKRLSRSQPMQHRVSGTEQKGVPEECSGQPATPMALKVAPPASNRSYFGFVVYAHSQHNHSWLLAQVQRACDGQALHIMKPGEKQNPASPCDIVPHECAGLPQTPPTDAACPYLQKQQCQQNTIVDSQVTRDVLTNLQNLLDAEDLFQVAEKLRQRGEVCEALDCYEIVSKLCPGSRIDEMANQAKSKMFAGLYGSETGTSSIPETKCTSKASPKAVCCEPGVCEQVTGLMKACRLAIEMGRHQKAAELAREAYAMDHAKVEADPLVYKMHVLGRGQETVCPKDCTVGCCIGACTGGVVGAASRSCGHGSVMGEAFGCCLARMGCCSKTEACSQGCGKGKCCQGCAECSCKSCGCCKCECREGEKCLCCEAKSRGHRSCGCVSLPCTFKAGISDCPIQLGHGKKAKCGPGCHSNAEEECEETECPVTKPGTAAPVSNNQSPCTRQRVPNCPPPVNMPEDDGGSAQLQPALPPVDGTVVQALEKVQAEAEEQESREDLVIIEEDNSSKPKFELTLGLNLLPSKISGFETTCADIQVTPEQIKLTWQVKVGPWVCQVRYGQPGLQVDVQPLEPMDD